MNITSTFARGVIISLIFFAVSVSAYAEGTKQLSPDSTSECMLYTNGSGFGLFAEYNSGDSTALFFRIRDTSETVYIGLSRKAGDNGALETIGDYQFRIVDPSGNVVHGPYFINNMTNNATTWSKATAGPDVLAGASGYSTALAFATFSPDTIGDFRIEFSDSPNPGVPDSADVVNVKWFDFTVVDSMSTEMPGRLWALAWALRTPPLGAGNTPPECQFNRPFNGTLFSYTMDGFVSKIDFDSSEFQGLTFNVSFGLNGPGTSGDIIADRMSVKNINATVAAADHMVFVSEPDVDEFPSAMNPCGDAELIGVQCLAQDSFCIMVGVTRMGQVEIVLDFGADSLNVILAMMFDQPDTACLFWDGLKGDGSQVEFGDTVLATLRYSQGVQHYAAYDVELLKSGFCVETVRPICPGVSTDRLYWDDSNITDDISTSIDESDPGTGQPQVQVLGCQCGVDSCRTWTNFQVGNANNCTGSPMGYGENNTLNTWWFASNIVIGPLVLPIITVEIVGDTSFCAGSSTVLMAMGMPDTIAYTYAWSGPGGFSAMTQSTGMIGVAGTYYVTITDTVANCTATDSAVVVELALPVTSIDFTCVGANMSNADIDLTVSGAGPFTYLWSTGAMTEDLTNVAPGTYTVQVTDTSGCMASDTVTVEGCCELMITCPASGGLFSCLDDIPLPDTNLIGLSNYCDSVTISVSDAGNGAAGCQNDTLVVTRTYLVTDATGATMECVQLFQVVDDLAPVITSDCPSDTMIACGESIDTSLLGAPIFMDVCDGVMLTFVDDSTGFDGSCTANVLGEILRTFFASDSCGNVDSSCVQIISIIDTIAPTFTTPMDIVIDCEQDSLPATTGIITDTLDNCSSITLTFTDQVFAGVCPVIDSIVRTWLATDACGNQSIGIQTITREDNSAPTYTLPADITIACDQDSLPSTTGDITDADDNCSAITITFTDVVVPNGCPVNDSIFRTWEVSDACGNSSMGVQLIIRIDTVPPTFTLPGDTTISCELDSLPATTGNVTDAIDNCTAATVVFVDSIVPGLCEGTDTIYRTWIASDLCGNNSSAIQTIVRVDTTGPVITFCPADTTVNCDGSIDPADLGSATATDNCTSGGTLIIRFIDDSMAGQCDTDPAIQRTWIAEDACGNVTTCLQTITIQDTVAPMVLSGTCPADISVDCSAGTDTTDLGAPSYADNCTAAGAITITFSDDSTGFDGSCASFVIGTITRTFYGEDDCGNIDSSCVQVISLIDTIAPAFTIPADIIIDCGLDSLPATTGMVTDTTDNCSGGITVSFSDVVVQNGCPAIDTIFRTWSVSDACGNINSAVQVIVRTDTVAPTFTLPADVTLSCTSSTDTSVTGVVTDTLDNCMSVITVTFSDQVIAGICAGADTTIRTWVISDECNNSATGIQTIVREDTSAPSFTVPADIVIECDDAPDTMLTGYPTDIFDSCSMVILTFSDNVVAGECPATDTIYRTWTAVDDCGNTNNQTQVITRQDTVAPMVLSGTCPADISVDCSAGTDTTDLGAPSYTDNCTAAGAITITFSDDSTGFDGSCTSFVIGTITRTFYGEDDCGNIDSSCVQVISLIDTIAPAFTIPGDITIDCGIDSLPSTTGIVTDTTDNCSGGIMVSFSDVVVQDGCPARDTIFRNWSVSDACGNINSAVQVIVRTDTVAPSFTLPADVTLSCTSSTDTSVTGGVTDTIDNCMSVITVTFSDQVIAGICAGADTTIRTWVISDECNNSATGIQTIVREDTSAPSFTVPVDIVIECDDAPDTMLTGYPTAIFDSCSMVILTFSDNVVAGECPATDTIYRTWTAVDDCGNTNNQTQVITRQDTVAPMVNQGTCPPNVSVECFESTDTLDLGAPSYSDNCGMVSLTYSDDSIGFMPPGNLGQIIRTFYGTDDCGNVDSSCVQTITVQDITPPTITCPGDTTVFCPSDADTAITGLPIIADNCNAVEDLILTFFDDSTGFGGSCSEGSILRTFVVADLEGNTNSCTQNISVQDNEPPMFSAPADIDYPCEADIDDLDMTGRPTGVTDCNEIVDTTYTDTPGIDGCDGTGSVVRTWLITDACGNTASETQVITLIDITPPSITAPADIEIVCELDPQDTTITGGDFIVSDNCSAMITVTFSDVATPDCGATGTIQRTWSAEDECGNIGTAVQMITIIDTVPPTAICVNVVLDFDQGDVTLTPGEVDGGSFDNCGDVTLSLSQTEFNCLSFANGEVQIIQLTVTDECGNQSICDAEVSGEGGSGLQILCPSTIFVGLSPGLCESIVNYSIDVAPLCGSLDSITIEQIDMSGLTSGDFFPIGTTTQSYVAYTPFGDSSFCSFDIVVTEFPEENWIACNDTVSFSVDQNCEIFVNPDMILEGDNYGCYDDFLVEIESFGSGYGGVLIDDPIFGEYFNVTITNEQGLSCWGTMTMEDKMPPMITCYNAILECGQSTEPVMTDPVEGAIVVTEQPGSPIGPNGGVVTTQEFEVVVPAGAVVTDVDITIDLTHTFSGDLDVFLIGPDGTSVELATDACGANDDWANVIFDDEALIGLPAACTGGTPALTGEVQPEGLLADFNGLNATGTWTLEITDDAGGDGGVLNLVTLDIEYYLELPYAPTATDACGDVVVTYTETEFGEDCDSSYIERIWTATDESGNTASCLQTITIVPLTLDGLEFPMAFVGSCGDSDHPSYTGYPTLNGVNITDGGLCTVYSTWEDKPLPDCGGGIKLVRHWLVLDWCTQEVVKRTQVVKLSDNEGPVLTCPGPVTVSTDTWTCDGSVNLSMPTGVDACGTPYSLAPSANQGTIEEFAGSYHISDLPLGETIITWTAEDDCGNTSTCTYTITVIDNIPPVPLCDEHTIVSLTFDGDLDQGLTKVHAETFDDGSYDNCGPVTLSVRRMTACPSFNIDWTTKGACIDATPNGTVNSADRGTQHGPCVPFFCCDVGAGPIMVELRVQDAAMNVNFCMVEVEVQDKLAPQITSPPDITVSCEYWFVAEETGGQFIRQEVDVLTPIFGLVLDAYEYDPGDRQSIIIDDPGSPVTQPQNWGLDGWADDNCNVVITVRVDIWDDCTGDDLDVPGAPPVPANAVRLIKRTFRAADASANTETDEQWIWVVDFEPFYITDQTCNNSNPSDGVIWPCDVEYTNCPEGIGVDYPAIFDDNCSLIGVDYDDEVFEIVDGACLKILRTWTVIDWCQYDSHSGAGLWQYVQVIKVKDNTGPEVVVAAPFESGAVTFCTQDSNISLPANNQILIGESNPLSTECSVHVVLEHQVVETCSDEIKYDLKFYPNNGSAFIQVLNQVTRPVDSNGIATLYFDSRSSSVLDVRLNGLDYNDKYCDPVFGGQKDYHRVLWSIEDGCGNSSTYQYLLRLEDCKQPTPVCVGLFTAVMPSAGEVTIWAEDFNASSADDCTAASNLRYSFSETEDTPSMNFTCQDITDNGGTTFPVDIWVADEGNDLDCNGIITWDERNKDFCSTFIVVDDNEDACPGDAPLGGIIQTEELESVESVDVRLRNASGQVMQLYTTDGTGRYQFFNPLLNYIVEPERNDDHANGVSTLDLVRIQQHLLGLAPFESPYKLIAADANSSQSVTAIDLVEIRKLILGLYLEYPNNDSWRFVDADFVFNDESNPWPFDEIIELEFGLTLNENFVAVKIGDVNGTVSANAKSDNNNIETRSSDALQLWTENRQVNFGELVHVPVRAENFDNMFGFQMTMMTPGLELMDVSAGTIDLGEDNVATHKKAVTISWSRATAATADDVLFTLVFRAGEKGALSDMLSIGSSITPAEAYSMDNGELNTIMVNLGFKEHQVEVSAEFALYQNIPNPFRDQTIVGFDLPSAMSATLTLYDVTGKVVKHIKGDYRAGYNEISIDRNDIGARGVVYYRLDAGAFTGTKKMILIE